MYSKILILRFPQTVVDKPLVANLVKNYNLDFNILNASIFPRKEGLMVMELTGSKKDFKEGVKYLKKQGVNVQNASQEINRNDDRCNHCGICTAVCPTGALFIQRPEMYVNFDQKKCAACELCMATCPIKAMKISSSKGVLFE